MYVSKRSISAEHIGSYPMGRSADMRITRSHVDGIWRLDAMENSSPIVDEFLSIISEETNFVGMTAHGSMFYRVMPPSASELNETHRDKGTPYIMNATSLVCADLTSYQLEFFRDEDWTEQSPIRTHNNYVQFFSKDLHRRPERPVSKSPKMFLSANLYTK